MKHLNPISLTSNLNPDFIQIVGSKLLYQPGGLSFDFVNLYNEAGHLVFSSGMKAHNGIVRLPDRFKGVFLLEILSGEHSYKQHVLLNTAA